MQDLRKPDIVLKVCDVCSLVDVDYHKIQNWEGNGCASPHKLSSLHSNRDFEHSNTIVKIDDSI
jgi:hypothetical protein